MRDELKLLLDDVATWADEFPCIDEAYVFGSFARGDHGADSDIDIGIKLADPLLGERLLLSYQQLHATNAEWRLDLGQRFGRRIELHGINKGDSDGPALKPVLEARNDPELCIPHKGKAFALAQNS